MSSSSKITDYIGVGLASARPATPNLATGAFGLYYATDTGALSIWTGAAWTGLSGSGTVTSVAASGTGISVSGSPITGTGTLVLARSFIGARAYNNGTQSISNVTGTPLTFNLNDYDTSSIHSTSVNTSRFTIPSGLGGKWRFTANSGQIQQSASGIMQLYWQINGTQYAKGGAIAGTPQNNNNGVDLNSTITLNLSAGDYVETGVFQSSGGTLTFGAASSAQSASCECEWLGA